jgi:hypothetical protein
MAGTLTLPLPQGTAELRLTLSLVCALEKAHGSLFALAGRLLKKECTLGEIVGALAFLYTQAQPEMTRAAAEEFLLSAPPQPPAALLADILVGILTPLQAAGAVEAAPGTGENPPPRAS